MRPCHFDAEADLEAGKRTDWSKAMVLSTSG
jgi:hypothetical protein